VRKHAPGDIWLSRPRDEVLALAELESVSREAADDTTPAIHGEMHAAHKADRRSAAGSPPATPPGGFHAVGSVEG